ncbi:MAG: sigma-E processing peptidase SpoIIGA [Clostridium sp.]|nr:sigma-E processing peptidase SpoIIGA [Clostridium sp.]
MLVIYADVLVLENTIVNLFLLMITMKCIRHKYKMLNILSAAFVGGLYTMVLFMPKLLVLKSFTSQILVAYLMIRIASGKMKFLSRMKILILFFLFTFMLSGICFLFSIKQNFYILGGNFKIEHYSIKYILLSIMVIYIIGSRILDYIKDRNFINNYNFQISFEVDGEEYKISSFLDTGNELREPVTNLPCILIEKEIIKNIDIKGKNVYYVPYNVIGSGGNLEGIRVNNIAINGRGISDKKIDAIVCPCKEKLSKENEFNALLSRGIV